MKTTRPIIPAQSSGIRTSRLFLRPIMESDIDEFFIIRSNPEVMWETTIGLPDADKDTTWEWMQKIMPSPESSDLALAVLAIEEADEVNASDRKRSTDFEIIPWDSDSRNTDTTLRNAYLVGDIGITSNGSPEIGYTFRREFWGKGYATEAMTAFLRYYWTLERKEVDVEDDLPELRLDTEGRSVDDRSTVPERLVARIEVKNHKSRRVAEKCGMRLVQGKQWSPQKPDHRGPATLFWYYIERPSSLG